MWNFENDMVKKIEQKENAHSSELDFARFLKILSVSDLPNCHVMATPLLELSSITVLSDVFEQFLDGSGGRLRDEIHFAVKLIDNDDRQFLLFDSDSDHCDTADVLFFHNNKLEISLEKSKLNRAQVVPKYLTLKLCLEDRFEDFEVVDTWRLDVEEPEVVYDKQQCLELRSMVYGLVFVHYTYFRHAVLASVDCTLVRKNAEIDDSGGAGSANVSGAISARFKVVPNDLITRVLFDQQDGGHLAKLSWSSWLAVPAYSSLEIQVHNMVVNGEKIDTGGHNLKFKPNHQFTEKVEILGEDWRFLVTVKWRNAYFFLPPLCECDYADEERRSSIDFSEIEDSGEPSGQSSEKIDASSHRRQEKKPRLQSIERPLSDVNVIMQRRDPLPSHVARPLHLVEIFSIAVCPVDNLDSSLVSGKIECFDFYDQHDVFNGVTLFRSHEPITIIEPRRCYIGPDFSMKLELKDEHGREMSRGYLSWDFNRVSLWLDRRICSIIPGNDGFAAVYYTIFSDAVQARVSVSFISRENCEHQVRGRIRTRYTSYRYSTEYDRKFYQSCLFQTGKREYVTLHNGDDVPLPKPVVSVPLDESLIVIANLSVVVGGRKMILRGKVEFQAQEADVPMIKSTPQSIGEVGSCRLVISVSWG